MIRSKLFQIHSTALLSSGNLDNNVEIFYSLKKSVRCERGPLRFSKRTIDQIKEAERHHNKFKRTENWIFCDILNELRKKCKIVIRNYRTEYLSSFEVGIGENPKSFWTFASEQRTIESFPANLIINNITHRDPQSFEDAFVEYFAGTFENPDAPVLHSPSSTVIGQSIWLAGWPLHYRYYSISHYRRIHFRCG